MKNIFRRILFLAVCTMLVVIVFPTILFAQAPGGVSFSSGTPEFNFQIPISGLKSLTLCEKKGDALSCPGIAKYVQVAYTFLVGFAAMLAVLAMTWGGVQWLISRGESGKIQEARKIIGNAVVGLIIALGSYTVLSIINPSLTQFNPLSIKPIKEIPLTMNSDVGSIAEGSKIAEIRIKDLVPTSSGPTSSNATDFPNIKWFDLPKAWSVGNEYGDVYADILNHAIISEAKWYKKGEPQEGMHPNRILDAHEYTHYTTANPVGNGKAFTIDVESTVKSSDIAKTVPKSLRTGGLEYSSGTIYKSYISSASDHYPDAAINIFVELTARNAASKVGIEMHKKGLIDKCYYDPPKKASLGAFAHPMENTSFIVFALALAETIENKDKGYLTREPQFKDALRFLIEDGRKVSKELEKIYEPVEKNILKGLQKNPDAQALRDVAKLWYGDAWTREWLGF